MPHFVLSRLPGAVGQYYSTAASNITPYLNTANATVLKVCALIVVFIKGLANMCNAFRTSCHNYFKDWRANLLITALFISSIGCLISFLRGSPSTLFLFSCTTIALSFGLSYINNFCLTEQINAFQDQNKTFYENNGELERLLDESKQQLDTMSHQMRKSEQVSESLNAALLPLQEALTHLAKARDSTDSLQQTTDVIKRSVEVLAEQIEELRKVRMEIDKAAASLKHENDRRDGIIQE